MKKIITILFFAITSIASGQGTPVQGKPRSFSTGPDYKKEIADLTTLIKQHPDSANYYVKRASLVYEINSSYPTQTQTTLKIKDVIPDIDKAISIQPNNASLYEQRGEYKWKINHDTTGALSDKSKAVELEPTNPLWLHKRGMFYVADLKNYDKACPDFFKGADMGDKNCIRALYNWCTLTKEQKKKYPFPSPF